MDGIDDLYGIIDYLISNKSKYVTSQDLMEVGLLKVLISYELGYARRLVKSEKNKIQYFPSKVGKKLKLQKI